MPEKKDDLYGNTALLFRNVGDIAMIITANRSNLEYMKKVWWSRPVSYVYVVLFSVLTVGTFFEAMLSLFSFLVTKEDFGFVAAGILLLCFCLYNLLKMCLMPQRLLKKINKISPDVVETVTFGENGFTADNRGSNLNEHVEYGYDRITKAYYSDNWFVICCDANRVYPIHTRSFMQGDPNQLGALLTAKLGAKYKRK